MEERIRQEKERAVKWIQTKKEEVVNAVKKIDTAQVISGMSDMAAGIGAVAIGVGALLVPGVGLVAGAIALGTVVCGVGLTVTGFGDVHQGFTGVDPVRNIAKSLGMSDSSYDTMKGGFMIGSLGGSIYSGNVVRMFGKAGSTLGMAAGSEAAGSTGKAVVSAEEEAVVVQRASTSTSGKTFTLPGDRNIVCDNRAATLKGGSNPAHNAAQYDKLKTYYYQAQKYGDGGIRELPDGRFRFYESLKEAKTEGEMKGFRHVREWNPQSGLKRDWYETIDHSGKIRQVRPKVEVTGGVKVHYMFDFNGSYTGSWSPKN